MKEAEAPVEVEASAPEPETSAPEPEAPAAEEEEHGDEENDEEAPVTDVVEEAAEEEA